MFEAIATRVAAGESLAVATVVRTVGSTPQVVGAKLVVERDPRARPFGTLGGGCVEADAMLAARDVLATGGRSLREYRLTEDLAWNSGLVCGGTMWILVEPGEALLDLLGPDAADLVVNAAQGGVPLAFVTRLTRTGSDMRFLARAVVLASGEMRGTLGSEALDTRARQAAIDQVRHGTARLEALDDTDTLLVEPVTGRPQLVIAGGGHVAKAMASQAMLIDFDVTILEDRPEFAAPERFSGAEVIVGDVPQSIRARDYGWQTYLVIATRGHKLDADCVRAAVETRARYIGVLGSRRKTVLLKEMLEELSVPPDRVAAIHAPIGLDLGGRTPAEIALAVLAEITQERYQGSGRPLRERAP